jgi:Ca-activated chloride channel family protein
MNSPHENHEPLTVEELHDRLIDGALTELIGRQVPPDLSARVLAADDQRRVAPAPRPVARKRFSAAKWFGAGIAAILLFGVTTFLLLPDVQMARESSRGLSSYIALNNSHASVKRDKELVVTSDGRGTVAAMPVDAVPSSSVDLGTAPAAPPTVGKTWGMVDAGRPQAPVAPPASGRERYYGEEFAPVAPQPASALNSSLSIADSSRTRQFVEQRVAGGGVGGRMVPGLRPADGIYNDSEDVHALGPGRGAAADSKGLKELSKIAPELQAAEGTGPGFSGDQYARIFENPFIKAIGGDAVSTFSIDVDTASYTNVRQFLMEMNQLPPADAVRIEELVNYFEYDYAGPGTPPVPNAPNIAMAPKLVDPGAKFVPFAANIEVVGCPWAPEHRLARIAVKGREMDRDKRPQSNLVFLVDVSGSMDQPNKLPLVLYGLEQLTRELGENDRVAIVVYASSEGLALPSTPGTKQETILAALGQLKAGGSTAGGAGIQLAYQLAEDNFIKGGTNRVILCTDGDFNVGVTSTAELERLCEKKAKDTGVFLSVLGFGRGNLNDAMMEKIADHGNGNYHYVDNRTEARRVLVEEMTGTLVTIAKDVKIQVEFNPTKVAGYRLIGYENRMLRTEDFNDDKKDAGEIGAGHTVTALYEIVPAGTKVDVAPVDELKYQKATVPVKVLSETNKEEAQSLTNNYTEVAPGSLELLTLKMRYKAPDGDTSKKLEWAVTDDGKAFSAATPDCQFAAAVAGFGLLLRGSQYKGNLTYGAVVEIAQGGIGEDSHGYRKELLEMVRKAKELKHE